MALHVHHSAFLHIHVLFFSSLVLESRTILFVGFFFHFAGVHPCVLCGAVPLHLGALWSQGHSPAPGSTVECALLGWVLGQGAGGWVRPTGIPSRWKPPPTSPRALHWLGLHGASLFNRSAEQELSLGCPPDP